MITLFFGEQMKISIKFLLAAAVLVTMGWQQVGAQDDSAGKDKDLPTAESILKTYVDKTGGAEKYKAIKSQRATGTMSVPSQGISGTVSVISAVPNKVAVKVEIEGIGTIESGANGEIAWENSAIMGPRVVDNEKEAAVIMEQSNMQRVYEPSKFYKSMKTLGTEEVDGKNCYKVELTTQQDEKIESFYEVDSGLELKNVRTVQSQMGPITLASYSSDYRDTDGIKTPFKVEQKLDTGMVLQVISMDKIEFNVDVPSDAFAVPEPVQKLLDKKAAKEAETVNKEPAGSDK
jgi:hypothetical protein